VKQIVCPLNGPRDISEFVYGGEVRQPPDTATCSDEAWADYLFMRANRAGVVREWWLHEPSGFWFIAERDTVRDLVIRTYEADAVFETPTGSTDG
jgi:sarcosine oxidase subunit delta